jgi:adenylate kinase
MAAFYHPVESKNKAAYMDGKKEIFIFIGPPGAGKGTLAQLCSSRMGWVQCSTGDLCRQHVNEGTQLGKQIDLIIKSGKLISDDLVIEMVEDWLVRNLDICQKVIFDGFPRTRVQAELLETLLKKNIFSHVTLSLIKMELDSEIVVKRLMSRLVCANGACCAVYSNSSPLGQSCVECASPLVRRSDDVEFVIRERIATYYTHVNELIQYYEMLGKKIEDLSVVQPIEQVFMQFVNLVSCKTA